MMSEYKEKILNSLIDSYEKSKTFIGDNKVNQSFSVKITKLYPEYENDFEYETAIAIDREVEEMEKENLVAVERKKNDSIKTIILNKERIDDIYVILSRVPKADINEMLTQLLHKYRNKNDVLNKYCSEKLGKLSRNEPIKEFHNDFERFEDVLKAVFEAYNIEEETYIRDFSIKVFGKSKRFEEIKETVISILFNYGDFPARDRVLEELNIMKNPGYVYIKGSGIVTINGQSIDFSKIDEDMGISSNTIPKIEDIKVSGNRVVTIENRTTFLNFDEPDAFAVFLGGYHNKHRRDLIKKIYKNNSDKQYLHYGDIDINGFHILLDLRKKTGVHFEPYRMGVKELKEYPTIELTSNDRTRLKNLLNSEFSEVARYMLDNNCKQEQEVMD